MPAFFGLTWGREGRRSPISSPRGRLGTILGVITIGSGIGSAVGSWAGDRFPPY
jgi:hypothetical protein